MAIEYIVDVAQLAPKACVGCGGNIGPFVDVAEVEIPTVNGPIPWHFYLCKRVCARSVARLCGFAPGAKLDELANAAELLAAKEKENTEITAQLEVLRTKVGELHQDKVSKTQQVELLQGRVKQMRDRITSDAMANLALVDGDAV